MENDLYETINKNNVTSGYLRDMILFLLKHDPDFVKEVLKILREYGDKI